MSLSLHELYSAELLGFRFLKLSDSWCLIYIHLLKLLERLSSTQHGFGDSFFCFKQCIYRHHLIMIISICMCYSHSMN